MVIVIKDMTIAHLCEHPLLLPWNGVIHIGSIPKRFGHWSFEVCSDRRRKTGEPFLSLIGIKGRCSARTLCLAGAFSSPGYSVLRTFPPSINATPKLYQNFYGYPS